MSQRRAPLQSTAANHASHSKFRDLAGLAARPAAARERSRNALVAWARRPARCPRALLTTRSRSACCWPNVIRLASSGLGTTTGFHRPKSGPPSGSCRSPNVSASGSSRAVAGGRHGSAAGDPAGQGDGPHGLRGWIRRPPNGGFSTNCPPRCPKFHLSGSFTCK